MNRERIRFHTVWETEPTEPLGEYESQEITSEKLVKFTYNGTTFVHVMVSTWHSYIGCEGHLVIHNEYLIVNPRLPILGDSYLPSRHLPNALNFILSKEISVSQSEMPAWSKDKSIKDHVYKFIWMWKRRKSLNR